MEEGVEGRGEGATNSWKVRLAIGWNLKKRAVLHA